MKFFSFFKNLFRVQLLRKQQKALEGYDVINKLDRPVDVEVEFRKINSRLGKDDIKRTGRVNLNPGESWFFHIAPFIENGRTYSRTFLFIPGTQYPIPKEDYEDINNKSCKGNNKKIAEIKIFQLRNRAVNVNFTCL